MAKAKLTKNCDNCANCICIGDGDYFCDTVWVKEEHLPTDNYFWCEGREWVEEVDGDA